MATIDYNSGNVSISFFPSNRDKPVLFCDENTGGIQIATHGSMPQPNQIHIGNSSSTLNVSGQAQFDLIHATEIMVSSMNHPLTLSHEGLNASGLLLNVQEGNLNVSGSHLSSYEANGFNGQYLSIWVNGIHHKIALLNP